MVPWSLLLLALPAASAVDKYFGVAPDLIPKYTPTGTTWKCLDGSKDIPWDFVNDDSCDCPDGSDEPGTGACPNSTFYCRNTGHIGASIPASRVRDGLCEPQCCDGSDERPGVCPNICQQVGSEYRKKRDAENKIRKTGAKVRSTYIAFAQKEKIRLEGVIDALTQQVELREKEVARLKDIADRAESLSAAVMEHKQQSPLYTSIIQHSLALKSLQREHKKLAEEKKALGDILDSLRKGYNPNYQDMAVLEAVRGWEVLAKLPPSNERDKEEDQPAVVVEESTPEEVLPEGEWTADELESDLGELLKTDYLSLLLEHDEHVATPPPGSGIFNLASYLPDSLLPTYEDFTSSLVSWLQTVGIVKGDASNSADTSKARQAFNDAETSLKRVREELKKSDQELSSLFTVDGFGTDGEWKKLDKTCLEKNTGEYTYEICLFGEAKQKPNNGGSTFSLGRFSSWNTSPDVKAGSPEYYQKQIYNRGARCWNGPERSVALVMTCGVENALLTVVELEKCEYQITGTTPALCLPLDDSKVVPKDEL